MNTLSRMFVATFAVMAFAGGATAYACSDCGCSTKTEDAGKSMTAKSDIVATAISAGKFETLVAAVKAAGLVEVLQSEGPFTVLAPTDEAFAKLPKGTVETLLKPENKDQLVAILTYHVIPAKVKATDALDAEVAKTVQGQSVSFDLESRDGKLVATVNGADILYTDISTSNGVIHVIDEVLLPAASN
ncbi:MAG: fasciclin domain-containing protein [Phycisphaeraceae bacterium]